MNFGKKLSIFALAAALGSLIVPAFAQNGSCGSQAAPDQGMSMGYMGQDMMRGGMMSRSMMDGGCSEMMQSTNNGGGRPNSRWQKHPDNGG
jgi:hypothetical protein